VISRRRSLAIASITPARAASCERLEPRRLLAAGSIVSGRVFRDFNSNNVYEPASGETPLGGVRVFSIARPAGLLRAVGAEHALVGD
jgi:hypothetical protein